MSKTDEATENPNDKQSPGKPLGRDEVVPTDNNGVGEDDVIDMDKEGVGHKRDPGDTRPTPPPAKGPTIGGEYSTRAGGETLPDDGSAERDDLVIGGLEETRPGITTDEVDPEPSSGDLHGIEESNDLNTP